MKKKVSLLLIGLLLSASLSACSDEGNTFETRTYTPEGVTVNGIDVQVTGREIVAIPSSDGQFHIDYSESAKEFYDISVSDSGILTMVSKNGKTWTDYIGMRKSAGATEITIHVPEAALSTLALCTTNEGISLPALTVTDQLALLTYGGDISFENVSAANSITLESKNDAVHCRLQAAYADISFIFPECRSQLPPRAVCGSTFCHAGADSVTGLRRCDELWMFFRSLGGEAAPGFDIFVPVFIFRWKDFNFSKPEDSSFSPCLSRNCSRATSPARRF